MNPRDRLSQWATRHLSYGKVTALRNAYFEWRQRLLPVLKAFHGTFGAADLRRHLEERIGKDFEVLMVHSSVNHMKPMYLDGPLDLVRMLVDFCGPTRTLAMPAFYFGEPGSGGAYATFQRKPRFDIRRTASQMGLATELFRRMPGVRQSRHPVYRISALGPLAERLTTGHENASSPAGKGSPFETMTQVETCIIGIGKSIEVLTQAHHTEEIMADEFPWPSRAGVPLSMTLIDGGEELPFVLRARTVDARFDIWKIRDIMSADALREWRFHGVPLFATRANQVTAELVSAARRGNTLYRSL